MVGSRRWSLTSNDSSNNNNTTDTNAIDQRQPPDDTASNKKTTALPSIFRSDAVTSQLQQVFIDLASERKRRLELEAKVRALEEQVAVTPAAALVTAASVPTTAPAAAAHHHPMHHHHDGSPLSRQQATALQAELAGYRQLIDALTHDKPAIAAALQATEARRIATRRGITNSAATAQPSLPLHVIQLLEVMPWDPKAQELAFGTEELYEWQVYHPLRNKWTSELRYFPLLFQALPTKSLRDDTNSNSNANDGHMDAMRQFLGGGNKQAQTSVLTDGCLTHLVNVRAGYSLPRDGGTWQWVGGWRFNNDDDQQQSMAAAAHCDEDGWSYATDPGHFLAPSDRSGCHDAPGQSTTPTAEFSCDSNDKTTVLRTIRRRRWTRRRVLVDYPLASEASKRFLQLLAHNASLTIAANKISDQLVATKMSLTQTELDRQKADATHAQRAKELEAELARQQAQIALLEQRQKLEQEHFKQQSLVPYPPYLQPPAGSGSYNKPMDLLQRPEQLRSLIANIVGGSQRKLHMVHNASDDDDGHSTSSSSTTVSANPAAPEEAVTDTSSSRQDKKNASSLLEFSTTDIQIYDDPDDPKLTTKKNHVVATWKQMALDKIKEAQQVSGGWLPAAANKETATTSAPRHLQPSLNLQDYEEPQPWSTADEAIAPSTTV